MTNEKQPPNLGVMLGDTGGPVEFYACGRKWKMGHPTQKAKVRLEKLLAKRALDEVRNLKDTLDRSSYLELFDATSKQITRGEFKTWAPGWINQLEQPDGSSVSLFILSLLQEHHPETTEADLLAIDKDAPEEALAALEQVLPSFFLMLLENVRADIREQLLPKWDAMMEQIKTSMKAKREALVTIPASGTSGPTPENSPAV